MGKKAGGGGFAVEQDIMKQKAKEIMGKSSLDTRLDSTDPFGLPSKSSNDGKSMADLMREKRENTDK